MHPPCQLINLVGFDRDRLEWFVELLGAEALPQRAGGSLPLGR
jgi:hypothetical protein